MILLPKSHLWLYLKKIANLSSVSVYDDILFRGDKVVIPHKLTTLKALHVSHLGIQHSLSTAVENINFKGMTKDIAMYVYQC